MYSEHHYSSMEIVWIFFSILSVLVNERFVQMKTLSGTCGLKLDHVSRALNSNTPMFSPWAVSIGMGYPGHQHFCTGTLIKGI